MLPICRVALSVLLVGIAAAAETAVVTADGKPAVRFTLPAGWSSATSEQKLVLLPSGGAPHIQIWRLASSSVADAEKELATLVVSEVTKFKATSSSDLTVAGNPARQVIGTGEEADDGDPANAEVTVFTVSGKVYLLIAHGEGDGTKKKHGDVAAVLASATAP